MKRTFEKSIGSFIMFVVVSIISIIVYIDSSSQQIKESDLNEYGISNTEQGDIFLFILIFAMVFLFVKSIYHLFNHN